MGVGSQVNPGRVHQGAPGRLRTNLVHGCRLTLLAAVVWLIHDQHRWRSAQEPGRHGVSLTLSDVQPFFPAAVKLGDWVPSPGGQRVLDGDDQALGYVIQTSPQSDAIVGYSGPTNTLVAFDLEHRVLGVTILASRDTIEHVADVRRDPHFLTAFRGSSWVEIGAGLSVDAVSGATLTSLAIAEGIAFRVAGEKPGLRFPDPIKVPEVQKFFPSTQSLTPRTTQPTWLLVTDAEGRKLGTVFRTAPAADEEIGYQGPTDTLIVLNLDERVIGIALRKSFDNEPYVGYVRDDEYFRSLFQGKTLAELARLDPKASRIEGVSGATMTSLAMTRGMARAATDVTIQRHPAARRFVFGARDLGTLVILGASCVLCFSRWRGQRWLRIAYQILLIGYFGFLNGDLLSQAQLVGWAQSGVPWRLAPGLTLLTAAALLVPAVSKKQLYCHHVCPFGAAQQLIKLRLPWRLHVRRSYSRLLAVVPGLLLALVAGTALWEWPIDLASLEPFDAFVVHIAGWATICVAIGGLIAATMIPMAYCRFGCPTGAILSYVRANANSGEWTYRDVWAVLLLLLAAASRFC